MKKALVLSLAVVLGLGVASLAEGVLSGSWDTTIGVTFAALADHPLQTITIDEQVIDCMGGEVVIPDQDIDVTIGGHIFTVTVPGDTYDVQTGSSTIGTVTIPDLDIDVTLDGEIVTITVEGGTFDCTGGTVTIPAYDIVVAAEVHSVTTIPVIGINSVLTVDYSVSGWSFTSVTTLDETGWLGQSFDVTGALGAFVLGSTLVFDPASVLFESWEVTSGVAIVGVTFDATFALVPGDTMLEIVAGGKAGLVTVTIDMTFGSAYLDDDGVWQADDEVCDFDWAGVDITVAFPFSCANITSKISFDCDGFNYVNFVVKGIAIPNLPWVKLNATLKFTVLEKTLVFTPVFNFGATACFDLYIAQEKSGNLTLGDFYFDGIGLKAAFGGVEFYGLSFWGTHATKPLILGDYWEMYQIKTTDDGCCGPFGFTVQVFFEKGGLQLFDVAEIAASMEIQIATQFTFSTGIAIDLSMDPAFTEWTIGFLVEW